MGKKSSTDIFISPTAIVDPTATIGNGTKIWAYAQIAEHVSLGRGCVIGNGVYIDRYVKIGSHVRIHNKALIYQGVVIEDDVFIGPGVCFTNDRMPRSYRKRSLTGKTWRVGKGASIGANATILPDVLIGPNAVIGAGSVVTKAVSAHLVVAGNPARPLGIVCDCGHIEKGGSAFRSLSAFQRYRCAQCHKEVPIPPDQYSSDREPVKG